MLKWLIKKIDNERIEIIREEARRAIYELLRVDSEYTVEGLAEIETLRTTFKEQAFEYCKEKLAEGEAERIRKQVSSEEFIDAVVERINRKQIERK